MLCQVHKRFIVKYILGLAVEKKSSLQEGMAKNPVQDSEGDCDVTRNDQLCEDDFPRWLQEPLLRTYEKRFVI